MDSTAAMFTGRLETSRWSETGTVRATTPKIGIYRAGLWVLDYDGDNAWTVPYVNEMAIGFGNAGFIPLIF